MWKNDDNLVTSEEPIKLQADYRAKNQVQWNMKKPWFPYLKSIMKEPCNHGKSEMVPRNNSYILANHLHASQIMLEYSFRNKFCVWNMIN